MSEPGIIVESYDIPELEKTKAMAFTIVTAIAELDIELFLQFYKHLFSEEVTWENLKNQLFSLLFQASEPDPTPTIFTGTALKDAKKLVDKMTDAHRVLISTFSIQFELISRI